MIKLKGIYKYYPEYGWHEVTYYLETRIFTLGCDSLESLLSLSESFWSPRSDMTVSQWNRAVISSNEDTLEIDLRLVS